MITLDLAWLTPSGPCVYKLFNANGRVIYIGSTNNVHQRLGTHMGAAWWWPQVVRADILRFPRMAEAVDAETLAIQAELPLWNTKGIPEVVKAERAEAGMAPGRHLRATQTRRREARVA